ncbi:MAG: hypothetical protein PF505_12245 [Vallitaleaceae bacterium]|nr:hypothetical protein [Vallitaleaceae bacterium]
MKKSSVFTDNRLLRKLNAKGIQLVTNIVLVLIGGVFAYLFFLSKESLGDFSVLGRIAVILFFICLALNF